MASGFFGYPLVCIFIKSYMYIISTLMAPVPFLLYRYGHKVRAMSKNVQNKAWFSAM